ncbi:MAG: hypothetical protein AAF387_13405 [Pseudomonadota bacterium]
MHYESKPETSKAIAIFTGTFGGILLYFGGFVASGLGALVLIVLGITLLLLTIVAATVRYSVSIDIDSGKAIKAFSSKIFNQRWEYHLNEFKTVGISAGGRGAFGEPLVVYCVELSGSKTLRLTAWNSDKQAVESEAQKVSEYLGLPVKF